MAKKKTPFRPKTSINRKLEPLTALKGRPLSEPWDDEDWRSLQFKILEFTMRDEFHEAIVRAGRLFERDTGELDGEDPEWETFCEWSVQDVRLESGQSILDGFQARCGEALPAAEREGLEFAIRHRGQRLWEYRGTNKNGDQTIRDILSGEEWSLNDPETRDDARPWAIIFARLALKAGQPAFMGPRYFLPPQSMTEIRTFADTLWKSWKGGKGSEDIGEFYRDRFLLLVREVRGLQEEASRPPEMRTPEGHRMVPMAAEFTLRDPQRALEALNAAEEFDREEPPAKRSSEVKYIWLQRGRSRALFGLDAIPNLTHEMLAGLEGVPGLEVTGPAARLLGFIKISGNILRLDTSSRERLAAGKELLEKILGGVARPHKRDIELDMDEMAAPGTAGKEISSLPPEALAQVQLQVREHLTRRWLEMDIPALGGQTPRQAAQTPQGRAMLAELLKQFEYMDAGKDSPNTMDLALVRRELGMETK